VVLVSQAIAGLHVLRDTVTLGALDALQQLDIVATDPLGSEIEHVSLQYDVQDTAIATVTDGGEVRARANGNTTVVVSGDEQSAAVVVRVAQQVTRIDAPIDTLRFTSIGEAIAIPAQPVDSLGHPVSGVPTQIVVGDTGVLGVESLSVRSKQNGATVVHVTAGGASSQMFALVSQVADRIAIVQSDTQDIQSVYQDSLLPITCSVLDHNGFEVQSAPPVTASASRLWNGTTCGSLSASASGFDTLRVSAGTVTASLPVALAVRPIIGAVAPLDVDQMPANTYAWSPSARRNSHGQLEVYFAGYARIPDSTGHQPANLYRLVSDDGQHFRYDGVVLEHDPDFCALNGSGIENIDVVPRNDGPGWRMFYAGGSFDCYGWQVFSAVSTDERTWTRETGVRIGNGGSMPPALPIYPPWPVGEGMTTDQLPDGTWRMIVGAYEPLSPPDNKFQILEWHSSDQLQWTYVGSVVTTRQLPPEGEASAYSPTLAEFAPGLWRMIFTADNRFSPGGRSRLWSAVSTDRVTWQVEGEMLGAPGVQYLYCALVGDRLVTLQIPEGPIDGSTSLVGVSITQP
jgi:hypothetical protein